MTEAGGGASPLETLCQQAITLTQAVQKLQEGYLQLTDKLQHLSESPAHEQSSAAPLMMFLPPEPRVPVPERFSGDRKKFRSFKTACLLYLALQPRTFALETVNFCMDPRMDCSTLAQEMNNGQLKYM